MWGSSNQDALAETYLRYSDGAYRLAYVLTGDHHVAEELVQEGFVRLWARFGDWRDSRWFDAYLRKTIVNLSRSRARRLKLEGTFSERQRREKAGGSAQFPDVEGIHEMWQALMQLPQRQRAALYFRYYEDLSEVETADILGCSQGALKSLVLRGLKKLRGTELEGKWSEGRFSDGQRKTAHSRSL